MRTCAVLLLVLLTAACGGSALRGSFSGEATFTVTCPNGGSQSTQITQRISIEAGGVFVAGACGELVPADVLPDQATMAAHTCPERPSDNGTGQLTVWGTVRLLGDSLALDLLATVQLTDHQGKTTTCQGRETGLLSRTSQ